MSFVVETPRRVTLEVAGSDALFPVRRFYTVGGNYRQRMGDPQGARPIMLKPVDSVVAGGGEIPYPMATAELNHEVEMIFAIGKGGADIPRESALDHVFGYGVMFDMVRLDLLAELRRRNRPQDIGKAFVGGSPCTALRSAREIGHPAAGAIWLTVNGEERQRADLADLVWDVAQCVVELSRLDRLEPGDVISTGTPPEPGVAARGDELRGCVEGVGELRCKIV